MAVVAIVGVMGAIAMATMSRNSSAQNSAELARSLQFAMMNARTQALSDGYQHRLDCFPATIKSYCNVQKLCKPGMNPVTTSCTTPWTTENRVQAHSHASIWSINAATDYATNSAGGTQSVTNKQVTFYPDGSADASTIYVGDETGTFKPYQFKIYVYSATGMSRLVNNW
jgi:Tfp pilus assembly protein FimT